MPRIPTYSQPLINPSLLHWIQQFSAISTAPLACAFCTNVDQQYPLLQATLRLQLQKSQGSTMHVQAIALSAQWLVENHYPRMCLILYSLAYMVPKQCQEHIYQFSKDALGPRCWDHFYVYWRQHALQIKAVLWNWCPAEWHDWHLHAHHLHSIQLFTSDNHHQGKKLLVITFESYNNTFEKFIP